MKRKQVTLAVLLAALSFFAAPSARALTQADDLAIRKAVANAPAAEVAAKAAQIVSQATKADRQDAAVATVREIVSKKPATLIAAIGAMTKAAPDLSVAIVTAATKLSPDQAAQIAKAAATSAPDQADQIAAAVAKLTPKTALQVTEAVALAVPSQSSKIVEMVLAAVPSAQNEITSSSVLSRSTQRSAATGGSGGIITTRPGTISGNTPTTPPSSVGTSVAGADPQRAYGSPE
jgi:hypothetical protein